MAQKSRRETGIDSVGRFIEKQDLRAMQQRAHQRQLLFHPSGKAARQPVPKRFHAGHAQQLRCERRAFGAQNAEQIGVEIHVFPDGEVQVQAEFLRHIADAVFDGLRFAHDIVAGHAGAAFAGIQQAAEHAQRRGFARAVRPDEAEDLAGGNGSDRDDPRP